ncbi:sopre germination protein [Neobacillus bataviensis LMG 21833]|uniref:Sopre germination protein n=1 Tax=Neobacillus bataviensis LMG 21833 TaxID=1117379 RepID=K6DRK0_9BACI|nr:spore germination protein [Neobacillus bataviensis]EKN70853.1 sopre germination protein [Neobacillus bataviensis LMG 21833]
MFFKNDQADKVHEEEKQIPSTKEEMVREFKNRLQHSLDLMVKNEGLGITLLYIETLIDKKVLHQDIISQIKNGAYQSIDTVMDRITVGDVRKSKNLDEAIKSTLSGSVIIHLDGELSVLLVKIPSSESRSLTKSENESQVIGSQIAFNESLATNITLIRRYIADPNLCNEMFHVGSRTHTAVSMLYVKGIANEELVTNLRRRITNIKIDAIIVSTYLSQLNLENCCRLRITKFLI